MVYAAVLGFGTVGSGVVELIDRYQDVLKRTVGEGISVRYILDIRSFPDSPYGDRVTADFDRILDDPGISVICEAMGGIEPAYTFTRRALERGISVCTSNKELVISRGAELIAAAREHGCRYLFEASAGGGIPLIRPLVTSLAQERITRVTGILNGTTNYILTRMRDENADFDEVLREAQQLGYAERDPAADTEGHDACRKISILASLISGKYVDPEKVRCSGITCVRPADFKAAESLGMTIRLLGRMETDENGRMDVVTGPFLVPADDPLYSVNGVFNAVTVHGEMVDDVLFYGRGAGKEATASAVVSDLLEAARGGSQDALYGWSREEADLSAAALGRHRYLVRCSAACSDAVLAAGISMERTAEADGCCYFETEPVTAEELDRILCASGDDAAAYRFLY